MVTSSVEQRKTWRLVVIVLARRDGGRMKVGSEGGDKGVRRSIRKERSCPSADREPSWDPEVGIKQYPGSELQVSR